MAHLLRIHIGPVQDFIASARRSRDLWYGSWLLSELSKAAARGIVRADVAGLDALVFPCPPGEDWLHPNKEFAVINEVVAIVSGDPSDIAQQAHQALCDQLDVFKGDTFTQSMRAGLRTWDIASSQIDDLVEFYWVSVPMAEDQSDYAASRQLADRLLAARKNTRTYAAVPWHTSPETNQAPPKSSLDGARESVLDPDVVKNGQEMYRRYKARRGEQLSGVDLLKRLGKDSADSRFPSTSHMAAMPIKQQLEDSPEVEIAWEAYLATVSDLAPELVTQEKIYHHLQLPILGDLDGSLLFASRLTDYLDGDELRQAERALTEFFNTAAIDRPLPYYALLVGDGDFMGRTISQLTTVEEHRTFSKTLATFAEDAKAIINQHGGAAVFAGGDDVLALLPLNTAIQCAAELAATFRTKLLSFDQSGASPTFSAGIAIVHHLEPLEDALALARDAEKTAKALPDGTKNAVAVTLDKRSGVVRTVSGHWEKLDRRLLNLAALHQQDLISARLAYQLSDTFKNLGGIETTAAGRDLRPILAKEAERLVNRKRVAGGDQQVAEQHSDYLARAIESDGVSVRSLGDELIIAAHVAEAATLARNNLVFQDDAEEETS